MDGLAVFRALAFPRRFRWTFRSKIVRRKQMQYQSSFPRGAVSVKAHDQEIEAAEQVDGMIKQRRAFVPPSYWEKPKERFWWLDLERHFQATEPKDNPGTVIVEIEKRVTCRSLLPRWRLLWSA